MSRRLSTLLMLLAAMVGCATPHRADAVALTGTASSTSSSATELVARLQHERDTAQPARELSEPEWSSREGGDSRSLLAVLPTHTTPVAVLVAATHNSSELRSSAVRAETADSRAPPLQ